MGEIFTTISELRQGKVKVPLDTRTKIIVVPDAMEREIVGKLFDSGKTFPWLDRAANGLRYVHRVAVRAASGKDVLIVMHTDPLRDASKSEQLSKDRAAMVAAWFEGDVQPWLDNYADSKPKMERWGAREDHAMLSALGNIEAVSEEERPKNADARYDALIRGFQRSRELTDDGVAGPVTRKQLVKEYFALSQVTDKLEPVPSGGEAAKASVKLAKHGAGSHFSLADAEAKRKAARAEAKGASKSGSTDAASKGTPPTNAAAADTSSPPEPAIHARLDFFFFFNKEGMDPAPASADGEEFLQWVALAAGDHQRVQAQAPPPKEAKTLSLGGAHFRTGSAVLLPESAAPTSDKGTATTSLGALAMALRFNEERSGHKLLIAGHTDSVGSDKDNDKLSEQRARLVHATLMGDRDTFVDITDRTGTVSDWKQIFKWAAAAFPSVEALVSDEEEEEGSDGSSKSSNAASSGSRSGGGASSKPEAGKMGTGFSACDPGDIDEDAASGKFAALAFQSAYNENYKFLGGSAQVKEDGLVGKQTWGAIYDLYQYNMAQELGEDFDGLQSLRDLAQFLPTKYPYVGFGEHHPADGNFKDNVESEANRRVEILFFAEGNEPDIGILDEAPELSELYENDAFVIEEMPARRAGARKYPLFAIRLLDALGEPLKPEGAIECFVLHDGQRLDVEVDSGAWASFRLPIEGSRYVSIFWGDTANEVRFRSVLHVDSLRRDESREAMESRLVALGYAPGRDDDASLESALKLFQEAYALGDDDIKASSIPPKITDALKQFFEQDLKASLPDAQDEEKPKEDEVPVDG